jgi:hypothetical protein
MANEPYTRHHRIVSESPRFNKTMRHA